MINGSRDSNVTLKLDKDANLKVFKVDRYGDLIEKKYKKEIIDKKEERICLKYYLYPNQSSSSFIAFYKNRYYVFHPYFEEIKVFDEKEDALRNFLHNELYPKGADDYKRE